MTLESVYNRMKQEYLERYGVEDSWQWIDEGQVYAIQEVLSHMGELTDEDYQFASKVGITDLCVALIQDELN